MSSKRILITSALPYVNNTPHLGNIIGCVLSGDAFARFCRSRNKETLYICGTDEYGSATEFAANKENLTPSELCLKNFARHKKVYEAFNISFDHFGRTSANDYHIELTQEIFNKIKKNNPELITLKNVKQFKCERCDRPLADRFVKGTCYFCKAEGCKGDQCDVCSNLIEALLLINPECGVCGNKPIVYETEHFFLNLEHSKEKLKGFLLPKLSRPTDNKEDKVNKDDIEGLEIKTDYTKKRSFWSKTARDLSKALINNEIKPRCITRDLKWGVAVPGLPPKVFYIWFDAPVGYISITKEYLKEDYKKWWFSEDTELVEFMGKDNVPFHSIYFPSSLIATQPLSTTSNDDNVNIKREDKYVLPNHISATHYLLYEDSKFSKSNNTGIFGEDILRDDVKIDTDVWRFYLLRIRPENGDSRFTWLDLKSKNNEELANNYGNLVNRIYGLIKKNYSLIIAYKFNTESFKSEKEALNTVYKEYIKEMETVNLMKGIKKCLEYSSLLNCYVHDNKLWSLCKEDKEKGEISLGFVWWNILVLSKMFSPFIPTISTKVLDLLKTGKDQFDVNLLNDEVDNKKDGEVFEFELNEKTEVLVRKLEDEEIEKYKAMFSGKGK